MSQHQESDDTTEPSTEPRWWCSFCTTSQQIVMSGPGAHICADCARAAVDRMASGGDDDERRELDVEQALAALPAVVWSREQTEDQLRWRVAELREAGVSWSRIGGALGVSRQAAWERFAAR